MVHRCYKSLFLFITLIFILCKSEARPEYALVYNNNRCTSCHYNPSGGGPRNMNGKLFQNRWFSANSFLNQDYVSTDIRSIFYRPEKSTTSRGGQAIMSGSVALHAALDQEESVHLVLEHNVAGFNTASFRDTYVLFNLAAPKDNSWFESLLVGRFRLPFGITTDEHRTYTRLASDSQWFSMQSGFMLSGTPSPTLHYDLGATNGLNNAGQTFAKGQSDSFGGFVNIRYMPSFFATGASARYHKATNAPNAQATSLYAMLSAERLLQKNIPVIFNIEWTQALGFNYLLNNGYVSDPNYASSLVASRSQGWLFRTEYWVHPKVTLIYQYDRLQPDRHFSDDVYVRNGIGLRWAIAAFTQFQIRSEWAKATHPSESSKQGLLSQNAQFAILEVKF